MRYRLSCEVLLFFFDIAACLTEQKAAAEMFVLIVVILWYGWTRAVDSQFGVCLGSLMLYCCIMAAVRLRDEQLVDVDW